MQKKSIHRGISFLLSVMLCITALFAHIGYVPIVEAASSYSKVVNTNAGIDEVFKDPLYRSQLKALHKAHPNWKFKAFYTGLDWEDCFKTNSTYTAETEMYVGRNLLQWNGSFKNGTWPTSWYSTKVTGSFNFAGNKYTTLSAPNWVQASEEAIRYCMDPRNFLNESQIFQFYEHSSETSLKAVQKTFASVSGSDFWVRSGKDSNLYYKKDGVKVYLTYAEAMQKIGKQIGINPVILAARVIQEQGVGSSPLISGTKAFTVTYGKDAGKKISGGYYNYFNMGATDGGGVASYDAIYNNGLTEAYYGLDAADASDGWNTRYKALLGGAQRFYEAYIKRGQSTFYFQKFCVDSSSSRLFWGQYMQSLTTPQYEASRIYQNYSDMGILNEECLFVIPVFNNMPEVASPMPTGDGNPNYKLASIYAGGKSVSKFNTDTLSYEKQYTSAERKIRFNVKAYADTTKITIGSKSASGTLATDVDLKEGSNPIQIICKAQNGKKRTYKVNVIFTPKISYGDIDGDGKYNATDLAYITGHLLGKRTLTGDMLKAGDINGDSKINAIDLAYLVSYLLGRIKQIPQR